MKMSNPKISQTNIDLVNKIRTELVEKTYFDDVKYNIKSKSRWKITGDVTEALSHILTGVAAVLAFAAGFFDYKELSFVAGCLGTISIVLLQFSSYATKESKERTQQVNRILDRLGIDEIADITIDSANGYALLVKNTEPVNNNTNMIAVYDNNVVATEV
ncbi:hypothetical protein QJ856_gp0197 [Tupanvirus deep ocean]|uniref:Uncharacterized protein n=2 Tax=Tupanvirus TaxID=2094720 RepID=A0AC62A9S5_9VIRU|nr:hypothetical protein QJ856_gp0197 [Tupanvirus deep ocean]QKU34531.1 hypothetical protein [Tupanvirus deep ocean]